MMAPTPSSRVEAVDPPHPQSVSFVKSRQIVLFNFPPILCGFSLSWEQKITWSSKNHVETSVRSKGTPFHSVRSPSHHIPSLRPVHPLSTIGFAGGVPWRSSIVGPAPHPAGESLPNAESLSNQIVCTTFFLRSFLHDL